MKDMIGKSSGGDWVVEPIGKSLAKVIYRYMFHLMIT